MAEFHPPEGLRKIIAEALRDAGMVNGEYDDSDGQWIVETKTWQYDAAADAVLAALFEACEVREEFGIRAGSYDLRGYSRKEAEQTIAEEAAAGRPDRVLIRWRVLMTPPAPVSSTGEEKTDG